MEITSKGMTTTKNPLINLMTTIYFTNHQKGQLVDFLKKHPCVIYVKNAFVNVNFKSLHSNKIKSVSTLTLKFSKLLTRLLFSVLLTKHVSDNFRKTMFSLRDSIKIVLDQ